VEIFEKGGKNSGKSNRDVQVVLMMRMRDKPLEKQSHDAEFDVEEQFQSREPAQKQVLLSQSENVMVFWTFINPLIYQNCVETIFRLSGLVAGPSHTPINPTFS